MALNDKVCSRLFLCKYTPFACAWVVPDIGTCNERKHWCREQANAFCASVTISLIPLFAPQNIRLTFVSLTNIGAEGGT